MGRWALDIAVYLLVVSSALRWVLVVFVDTAVYTVVEVSSALRWVVLVASVDTAVYNTVLVQKTAVNLVFAATAVVAVQTAVQSHSRRTCQMSQGPNCSRG